MMGDSSTRMFFGRSVSAVRWWFGLTWIVAGAGCAIWSPVAMSRGDWGGIYLLVGGAVLILLGWLVHPWGLSRTRQKAPSEQ